MEVRDPVHGSIIIYDAEIPILVSPFFQRLRNIKQLGFSEYSFPGATHTRYLHSIGVMAIATKVFDKIFHDRLTDSCFQRLRESLRLAALLHDLGHAPLSHSTESVMPLVSSLNLPEGLAGDLDQERQATHEDYTIKAIVDSSFCRSLDLVKEQFGIDPNCVAGLIVGQTVNREYFVVDGIDYFPLLHQLISGEMDCDRMDYLLRDSYFCGVSYGQYDIDWMIDNLDYCVITDKAYLGINERAIPTFDDFLLGRFHMFLMIYFHYRAVCLEKMLENYFQTSDNEYSIPCHIEEYLQHDDHYLKKVLLGSSNAWAKRIVSNNIPQKVFESFGGARLETFQYLEDFFTDIGVNFIRCSSIGRLSKYYKTGREPVNLSLKVIRSFYGEGKELLNIDSVTDLFEKFSQTHTVNRIHCDLHLLSEQQRFKVKSIISS